MKKSLIALAALAAVSAASAQSTATISGKFGVSVQQSLGSTSQIAVTDGNVTIAAVEDLGAGLKAGATIDMRTRGRERVVGGTGAGTSATTASGYAAQEVGRDATVFLSGAFGTVTAGSIELGNGITGNGYGGSNVTLNTDINNGGVLSANSYANILSYTSPAMSGFNASFTRADSIGVVSVVNTVNTTSDGYITSNNDVGLSANVVGISYANGPITASADYAMFSNETTSAATSNRTRARYSAAYDFGVFKVGAGIEDNRGDVLTSAYAVASDATFDGVQSVVGVSIPLGNLKLGATYARNNENGVLVGSSANGDEKATAWGVSAEYSFSKRTVLNASYADIKRTGGATWTAGNNSNTTSAGTSEGNPTNSGAQYRIRLMHSF